MVVNLKIRKISRDMQVSSDTHINNNKKLVKIHLNLFED
jgi:hypothetical protein